MPRKDNNRLRISMCFKLMTFNSDFFLHASNYYYNNSMDNKVHISEKATKFEKKISILFERNCGIFSNFCGLLRIHELYREIC